MTPITTAEMPSSHHSTTAPQSGENSRVTPAMIEMIA